MMKKGVKPPPVAGEIEDQQGRSEGIGQRLPLPITFEAENQGRQPGK